MQNTIKEELQQLLSANLVDAQVSDAELESVAGGIISYSTGGDRVRIYRPTDSLVNNLSYGNVSGYETGTRTLTYSNVRVQSV